MTKDYQYTLDQRRVTMRDAHRMYRAWAAFGWEMVTRPFALSKVAGEQMRESATRGLFDVWAPASVVEEMSREYLNLALGLLAVPSSAAAGAAAQFDSPSVAEPDPLDSSLSGTAPVPLVRPVVLRPYDAEEQMKFLAARAGSAVLDFSPESMRPRVASSLILPARVLDASQAWASWFVPIKVARQLMQDAVTLGHQPDEVMDALEPVAIGPGEGMVSLVATDYRASDFGALREIGFTLSVSPKGARFPDPGQMFLRLIVTDPYSLAAARHIWGIRKDYWDSFGITPRFPILSAYGKESVRFGVKRFRPPTLAQARTLELEFPRFGAGRSDSVPNVIYSMVESHDLPAGPIAPARSTLRRSGTGEGVQFGGKVRLSLPESHEKGFAHGCLCSIGMACVCDTLRSLGLHQRSPAANGWTEHMTGTLEEPARVRDHEPGKNLS